MNKIILDLCGGTGAWSKPYKNAGYDVRNITLPEYDIMKPEEFLTIKDGVVIDDVYGILCAPPCAQFSFARTNAKIPRNLRKGMDLVFACLHIIWLFQENSCAYNDNSKKPLLKFWALENPYYAMTKWFLGNPIFVFDPWEFGDMYKKRTALWGYFKEPRRTVINEGGKLKKFDKLLMQELKDLKSKAWAEDYINTKTRQTIRAITPSGFAQAFFEANK